ncbi:eukaryotic translation initiation factor 1A, X-chromosomal [Onychostruthus taczanowskii]|uniref:eukaryotic translation initiation factor 1A, X-chromosomal n=1 Tax=Onychostruthus taczanowskii TaxID=356909 RepID=UPI001B803388|nr:eukaryotic translation initiation factor 1A, X-chromosomal [Onychostruthus taczanowskii]
MEVLQVLEGVIPNTAPPERCAVCRGCLGAHCPLLLLLLFLHSTTERPAVPRRGRSRGHSRGRDGERALGASCASEVLRAAGGRCGRVGAAAGACGPRGPPATRRVPGPVPPAGRASEAAEARAGAGGPARGSLVTIGPAEQAAGPLRALAGQRCCRFPWSPDFNRGASKGGKNRRRGKNENESEKRELVFKEDGQEYAQVIKMLGNGRLEALCFDGVKRLCHIRGKLRKKVWINTSDIILIGLRDYQDNKADVILKYNADEARSLKAYGELPEHAKINETDTFGPGDDDEIQFDDIGDDDEDIDDI